MQNKSQKVKDLYNLDYWSAGFFDLDEKCNLLVLPDQNKNNKAKFKEILEKITAKNINLPVLIRFTQILSKSLEILNQAFAQAIKSYDYKGKYLPVYPIKVNQNKSVIKTFVNSKTKLGFEAGSKSELILLLGNLPKKSTIICNGYKDISYIKLALFAKKMGFNIYLVVEKLKELDYIISLSNKMKVKPLLGIRVKLASKNSGVWQASGGVTSKFGLSANQVLEVVKKLKKSNLLDCFELLHFHLGSQVSNIKDIKKAIQEAAMFYVWLKKLNINISVIDVGGGLGVDYEGSRSKNDCSVNYSQEEYANNIIYTLGDICKAYNLIMPNVFSESGRALSAHHCVLVTNVVFHESNSVKRKIKIYKNSPLVLKNMYQTLEDIKKSQTSKDLVEIYHDTIADLQEMQELYSMGHCTLTDRAQAENIYNLVAHLLLKYLSAKKRAHLELLDKIDEKLAQKFYLNFSLFQSMPDAWALGQIFPIMPTSKLDKPINKRAALLDITCDSDGAVKSFCDKTGTNKTMLVPKFNPKKPYDFAFFMVGAYQEILGDMHNLFAKPNVVDIEIKDSKIIVKKSIEAQKIKTTLELMSYEQKNLKDSFEKVISNNNLQEFENKELKKELEFAFENSSYLFLRDKNDQ